MTDKQVLSYVWSILRIVRFKFDCFLTFDDSRFQCMNLVTLALMKKDPFLHFNIPNNLTKR